MIIVYTWNFLGSNAGWGHASMRCDDTYISWWPEGQGRVRKVSPKIRDLYDAHPFIVRTFRDDILAERRKPDNETIIEGLNSAKVKAWWCSFNPQAHGAYGPPSSPWSSLVANCSTIVATALTVAGGTQRVPWYTSHTIVWTPKSVREYALAIANASPMAVR